MIRDLADLRRHLQWAIEVEHATLPPYLCALYSIQAGSNPEAVEVLQSVFIEEMLHLLQECFTGRPGLLAVATGAMYALKQDAIVLTAAQRR